MWTLVKWQWIRQVGMVRFWAALGTIALLSTLLTYGYGKLKQANPVFDEIGRAGQSGFMVPIIALIMCSAIVLPLLVSIWGAEEIASEKMGGTWQMLLAQGINPWKLWIAKWVFLGQFALLVTLLLVVVCLGEGILVFGGHGSLMPTGIFVTTHTLLQLLLMMTAYAVAGQVVVVTIALAFSSFMKHSLSAIMATMGSIVTLSLLTNWPFLSRLGPYLFTSYLSGVTAFLQFPPDSRLIHRGLLVYALYVVMALVMILWFEPFRD